MNLISAGRRSWWWLTAFVSKQRRWLLVAAFCGGALLVIFQNLLPLLPQFKPRQRIGLVGQYNLSNLPPEVAAKLGRGLFKFLPNGEVVPDLTRSWSVTEDQRRYVVQILPEQYWSDASPIRASDLKFNLPDIQITYPDETTIEFNLIQPFSPFLSLLTQPLLKNKTTSSGEYSLKAITWQGSALKRLRLTRQDQELDYRFYFSHQAAWLGLRLGEVDRLENMMINPLNEAWLNRLKVETGLNRQAYLAILFNLTDQALSNKSLRQALAYAVETKAPDESSRAISPLSPDSWAYNAKVKPYEFNPVQAQELFAKYTAEASDSGRLALTLGTSASFLNLAESIAASWEAVLPVQVSVKTVNSIEPDWQAILVAQEIPFDPDQHSLWHSTQPTNLTHYSDLKVDKLLEDGRQTMDQNERREIYQDFQRFLVEDSPAIFLFHPMVYTISRK
jgi:peptide/nickel transport system substrate-binding protein